MRTRACSALAALCLLAGCSLSSADDLKSRWVELPSPPASPVARTGPKGPDITTVCSSPTPDATFLAPIGGELPANRHLSLDGTDMSIESPEGTRQLSLTCDRAVYADVDADGRSDILLIVNQELDGAASQAALLLTPDEAFYLDDGEKITDISAMDEAVSYTITREGYADTVELALRRGVPVRIDQHGGLPSCVRNSEDITEALEGRPLKETPEVFPGEGPIITDKDGEEEESPQIPAYDQQPVFALAGQRDGYVRAMFLLDGGDIHRWTDYRCGWIRADKVKERETL
ncbi:MAG: hypothetical protein Q4P33_00215 [Flaviflexus sp.]|nr:hypothetical protein [Flaviflexus sp.]